MIKYLLKVKDLATTFRSFDIQQIPREDNSRANFLAKAVTTTPMALPKEGYFELIKRLTIKELVEVMQLDDEPCWINPLINFLKDGTFPTDWKEACKVKYQASQ